MYLTEVETQRIHTYGEARQAHRRRADHRAHLESESQHSRVEAGRQRDTDHVIEEGPKQVFMDVPKGRPPETDRRRHIREPVLHQYHIRRIDRDICTGTDRDAEIRAGEGRRIVDAVSDHRDTPLGLQSTDHRFLSIRQDTSDDMCDTSLLRDGPRRFFIIARDHIDVNAHMLKFCDGLRGILLDGVRDRDDPHRMPVTHEEKRGLSLLREGLILLLHPVRDTEALLHIRIGTSAKLRRILHRVQSVAGQCGELRHHAWGHGLRLRVAHDGTCQWMLGVLLEVEGQLEECFRRFPGGRKYIRHHRLP